MAEETVNILNFRSNNIAAAILCNEKFVSKTLIKQQTAKIKINYKL